MWRCKEENGGGWRQEEEEDKEMEIESIISIWRIYGNNPKGSIENFSRKRICQIERRSGGAGRKDITSWKDSWMELTVPDNNNIIQEHHHHHRRPTKDIKSEGDFEIELLVPPLLSSPSAQIPVRFVFPISSFLLQRKEGPRFWPRRDSIVSGRECMWTINFLAHGDDTAGQTLTDDASGHLGGNLNFDH